MKATRPCLSARSTISAGNATLASTKFNCTSSCRTASGQPSASEVKPTSNGLGSIDGLGGGGERAVGAIWTAGAGGTGRWLLLRPRNASVAEFMVGALGGAAADRRGVGAKVSPLRTAGATGAGAGTANWREAGTEADSGLVGPTEKIRFWLRWSNGLQISAGTSTCF